jgi:hypothetical protein
MIMPQGDKSSYTDRQKRKAEHIEEGYEKRGVSRREAERRAWATVNKEEEGVSLRVGAEGRSDAPSESRGEQELWIQPQEHQRSRSYAHRTIEHAPEGRRAEGRVTGSLFRRHAPQALR